MASKNGFSFAPLNTATPTPDIYALAFDLMLLMCSAREQSRRVGKRARQSSFSIRAMYSECSYFETIPLDLTWRLVLIDAERFDMICRIGLFFCFVGGGKCAALSYQNLRRN